MKKDEGEAEIRFIHASELTKAGLNLYKIFNGKNPVNKPPGGLIHGYSRVSFTSLDCSSSSKVRFFNKMNSEIFFKFLPSLIEIN